MFLISRSSRFGCRRRSSITDRDGLKGYAAGNMRPRHEQRDPIGQAAKKPGASRSDFMPAATCQKAWLVRHCAPSASSPGIKCPVAGSPARRIFSATPAYRFGADSPKDLRFRPATPCYSFYSCYRSTSAPGDRSKSSNSSNTFRCRNRIVEGQARSSSSAGLIATARRRPSSSILARPRPARMTSAARRSGLSRTQFGPYWQIRFVGT